MDIDSLEVQAGFPYTLAGVLRITGNSKSKVASVIDRILAGRAVAQPIGALGITRRTGSTARRECRFYF